MIEGGLRTKGINKINLADGPCLSVITVVFNGEKTLEDTIKSVLNQTYKNVEYIVVDGGSTDSTLEIIKKYDDQIAYWLSEKDSGLYDAMNKAIKLTKGDWVHILNADDYYVDNQVLEKASQCLLEPEKYFYYFTMKFQEVNGQINTQKYPVSFLNYLKLFYSAYIPHPTLFVARRQYDKLGLFDTNFKIAADHDLILRLCKNYQPKFFDIPVTLMRDGGVSSVNFKKTFADFREVTIKNGLNKYLAFLIFYFKVAKMFFKKIKNH